ncbi:MAG: hypothetical protein ABSF23_04360 [Terracidiphilus sp.]|jgi:hypothetical protein
MRWLVIVLLVSLGALLFAAAGVARHIWLHRARLRKLQTAAPGLAEESDQEAKP